VIDTEEVPLGKPALYWMGALAAPGPGWEFWTAPRQDPDGAFAGAPILPGTAVLLNIEEL
jgi:hypothetical protein